MLFKTNQVHRPLVAGHPWWSWSKSEGPGYLILSRCQLLQKQGIRTFRSYDHRHSPSSHLDIVMHIYFYNLQWVWLTGHLYWSYHYDLRPFPPRSILQLRLSCFKLRVAWYCLLITMDGENLTIPMAAPVNTRAVQHIETDNRITCVVRDRLCADDYLRGWFSDVPELWYLPGHLREQFRQILCITKGMFLDPCGNVCSNILVSTSRATACNDHG